jgi:hypothetical protein
MKKFDYYFEKISVGSYNHIINIWKVRIILSTYTDMLNIIPNVSLRFGYTKGIFFRELVLDISWLTTNLQLNCTI